MFKHSTIQKILEDVSRTTRIYKVGELPTPALASAQASDIPVDSLADMLDTLCGIMMALFRQADGLIIIPKYHIRSVMGCLVRLSREVRNRAMHHLVVDVKTALTDYGFVRTRVINELGGEDAVTDWADRYQQRVTGEDALSPREFPKTWASSPSTQDISLSNELDPGFRRDERIVETDEDAQQVVKPRIKTALDGLFRLAPLPSFASGVKRQVAGDNTSLLGHDACADRAPYGSKVVEALFPISLEPEDLLNAQSCASSVKVQSHGVGQPLTEQTGTDQPSAMQDREARTPSTDDKPARNFYPIQTALEQFDRRITECCVAQVYVDRARQFLSPRQGFHWAYECPV